MMYYDELKALRAKHSNEGDWSVGISDYCAYCTNENDEETAYYPCDVIKLLDEIDQLNFRLMSAQTQINNWRNEAMGVGE